METLIDSSALQRYYVNLFIDISRKQGLSEISERAPLTISSKKGSLRAAFDVNIRLSCSCCKVSAVDDW